MVGHKNHVCYSLEKGGVGMNKIDVYNACLFNQPISRSQARRICKRLRVYALAHPTVSIGVKNATSDVARMVYHVARGNMPENVAFK